MYKIKQEYHEPHAARNIADHIVKMVPKGRDVVFVCIGSDRSTGDSLGPLVGSQLYTAGLDVYGTLYDPVHAMNLEVVQTRILRRENKPFIIGIDACLGMVSSVGKIAVGEGPLMPGAGVGKELPPVGDMHIAGVVNVSGFMEYFVMQNTRLSLVMKMADVIVSGVIEAMKIIEGETECHSENIDPFLSLPQRVRAERNESAEELVPAWMLD